jgi:hypothetical protein
MSPWRSDPPVVWPGIYDDLPARFSSFLKEAAFSVSNATFCIWRERDDGSWQRGALELPPGDDPDGSEWMLRMLGGDPQTYQAFARDYYEADLPLSPIECVYRHLPLTDSLVSELNSKVTTADLAADAVEIGYPHDAV